jgi:hypothetical protein
MAGVPMDERVEKFLFGQGLTLEDYYIEQSPVAEVICYRNSKGREYDLLISDDALATAAIRRLKDLGVRIVKVGAKR